MKFILFTLLNIISSQCEKQKVRRNIKSLNEQELQRLVNAIKTISSQQHPNFLDRLTKVHLDLNTQIHNTPIFLPWHRYFLNEYEKELQRVDPEVTIPYWDWSLDSQAPERSEVLTDRYFGGNGRGPELCVTGPFSIENGYKVYYSANSEGPRCLKRNYNLGDTLSPFSVPERLDALMQSRSFNEFAEQIELTPHAAVHNSIGGEFGDISTHHSPNDPLFWLHHANIDRMWFQWQQSNKNIPQFDQPQWILPGFNIPVQQTLYVEDLCYTYNETSNPSQEHRSPNQEIDNAYNSFRANAYQRNELYKRGYALKSHDRPMQYQVTQPQKPQYEIKSIPQPVRIPESYVEKMIEENCKNCPKYNDRSNLDKLRPTMPIPYKWIQLNGFNEEKFRQDEVNNAKFVSEINSKPNYLSKACLQVRFNITQPSQQYSPVHSQSLAYGPSVHGQSLAYGPEINQSLAYGPPITPSYSKNNY